MTAWVVFSPSTPLDCCIVQIYMPTCSRSSELAVHVAQCPFLCLLMRQSDSKFQYIQQSPTDICLLLPPTFGKVGVQFFFARSARESCFVPHLKIRGAARAHGASVTRAFARPCPQTKILEPPVVEICVIMCIPMICRNQLNPFDGEKNRTASVR